MLFKSYDDVFFYLGNKHSRPYPKGKPRATRITRNGSTTSIAIRYQSTDVVTYTRECITLNSRGFHTPTTKRRMNDALPDNIRVFQKNFIWYIGDRVFTDGVQITYDGKLVGPYPLTEVVDVIYWNEKIKEYVENYINSFYMGELLYPNPDQCRKCYLFHEKDADHLKDHICNSFYPPYLLWQAGQHTHIPSKIQRDLRDMLIKNPVPDGWRHEQTFKNALINFLKQNLGV